MKWKIPVAKPEIGKEEVDAVVETVKSGWITQGRKVEKFEHSFAKFCNTKYGVATTSGTSALHTALIALGITEGDEVITTPLSCIATVNPILLQGAKPVFVDIDPTTLNIDVNLVEKKITDKTKAVIAVHLFGHPVDMEPLMEIAKRHNLWVIEDVGQALGAIYKGRRVGSIGDAACFSLYANKIITTGEGGAVTTNNRELADRMKSIRNFGEHESKDFYHPILGYNYKMTDIQAAIGLVQLSKIERFIGKRRENVAELNERLKDHEWIKFLPSELSYGRSVYFSYYVQMTDEKLRDKTKGFLEKMGIETRPFFCLIPDQPPYRKMGYNIKNLQTAVTAFNRGFYISNSPALTREEKEFIIDSFKKVLSN